MRLFILVGLLFSLMACYSETGTSYEVPDSNTAPAANISYNRDFTLPTYMTFADESALLQVQMGSQQLDLGVAAENRLQGFGDFNFDVVWRQSIMEDSRGIKGVRVGYYQIEKNSNEANQPSFHFLSRDAEGNIYLTETFDRVRSEQEALPYRQPSPSLFLPAKVEVGESWLAGPSMVPWFYDFSEGWVATLVDDQATAPVSGIQNTVQIKFHKKQVAYYMYFKTGLGVVEWLNSWEEDEEGRIRPLNGHAFNPKSSSLSGSEYTGYGWLNNPSAAVGTFVSTFGRLLDPKMDAYTDASGNDFPANDSELTYYWFKRDKPENHSAENPWVEEFFIPHQEDVLQNFRDYSGSSSIQPKIKVRMDGKTYIGDSVTGDVSVDWFHPFNRHLHKQLLILSGELVNSEDSNDTRNFALQISGIFAPHTDSEQLSHLVVHGLDTQDSLPPLQTEQQLWIYFTSRLLDTSFSLIPSREKLYYGFTETVEDWSEQNVLDDAWNCFSALEAGLCTHSHRLFFININLDPGRVYMQIRSEDADGKEIYRSNVFSLPVIAKDEQASPKPKARIMDDFPEYIRGSLNEDGEFTLGNINALSSSAAPGQAIVKYEWSFAGEALPPLSA